MLFNINRSIVVVCLDVMLLLLYTVHIYYTFIQYTIIYFVYSRLFEGIVITSQSPGGEVGAPEKLLAIIPVKPTISVMLSGGRH